LPKGGLLRHTNALQPYPKPDKILILKQFLLSHYSIVAKNLIRNSVTGPSSRHLGGDYGDVPSGLNHARSALKNYASITARTCIPFAHAIE
jgi:hypothetical protein